MLQQSIALYLESLRIANVSPQTMKSYTQALGELLRFLGPETDVRDIDVGVIRAYIHVLAAKGLCPNSRNHALGVFKAFGRFLLDEGITEDNVFAVVPRAKVPIRLISPPAVETVSTLLDGKMPKQWPARDRAVLELLYDTGVRVHEAAGLKLQDLRSDGTILIHGKGDKDRLVPIGKALRIALDRYLRARRRVLSKRKQQSQALFFNVSHRSANRPPETMDVRSVHRILKRACAINGLAPIHPHQLRHACATHMLDNGAALTVIQQLLGHAKLSTTALYAFVSTGLMQKTYNAVHPSCHPRRGAHT